MFGVNPSEALVILFVALLLFGPSRLPALGESLGRGLREMRRGLSGEGNRGAAANPAGEPAGLEHSDSD